MQEVEKGLTRPDLWSIAKYITERQKLSPHIPEQAKGFINWEDIESDWFDILEEITFGEQNNETGTRRI